MRRFMLIVAFAALVAPARASQDIANTAHNLSVTGPGTMKSLTIDRVCDFCHTPHNGSPVAPMWNRQESGATYLEYGSSTLVGTPGQPTGASRQCLACHDGTVALGAFLNPPGGQTNDMTNTLLTGRGRLGTDLGDDHPISFLYDAALQAQNKRLAHPSVIDLPLENGQMQCTTCHDPHEKDLVPFLRKTTMSGALCTTCHAEADIGWDWASSSHATSRQRPTGATPWPERKPNWRGIDVAENACFNCHKPHNAATRARLVKNEEEKTCYLCHDGTVAPKNVKADFLKSYRHPVDTTPNPDHDAEIIENPLTAPLHAECEDCHNPHAVAAAPPMISFNPSNSAATHTVAPNANASIIGVSGVDITGQQKPRIDFQYELCFKCHGLPGRSACGSGRCSTATSLDMRRQDGAYNIRDKVYSGTPGLVSYHPIESNDPSNNTEVPSLRNNVPLNRTDSLIYCTDCHASDTSPAAGGVGATGPHGATFAGMLAQDYPLTSTASFSSATYRLCFRCHDQASLMSDASGFPHNKHVRGERASCVNCHDPHGSQRYPHLINFLTRAGGVAVVSPVSGQTEPIWRDNGRFRGSCTLSCHGETHNNESY